jgi:amino acid permease
VQNNDKNYKQYWETEWDRKLISAFAVVLVSYTFQQNLFPVFNSLAGSTAEKNKKASGAINLALAMTFVVYISLGIICLYDFGTALDANVLTNVDEEKGSVISYIIRVSFLIVLACHIPYIFFTGKESMLIFLVEAIDK